MGIKPQPIDDSHKQIPKFITIHHGGEDWKPGTDPAKFVRTVQHWGQHRVEENEKLPPEKQKPKIENWPDLPYHFMIAPDGRIFEGRPIEYEPQSNTNYSLNGHIGVELMGNFETQRPSEQQLKSTVALVAWLCQQQHIDPSQVAGHRDRAENQTVCPGKDFYRYLKDGEFIAWVNETLTGKTPDVKSGPPLPGGPTTFIDSTFIAPATQSPTAVRSQEDSIAVRVRRSRPRAQPHELVIAEHQPLAIGSLTTSSIDFPVNDKIRRKAAAAEHFRSTTPRVAEYLRRTKLNGSKLIV